MRLSPTRARLLAVCLVCAALRLPSFEYGVISDDEAIYDAMAGTLASGGVLYRDAVDHKPPGLAFTYALLHRAAGGNRPLGMSLVHLLGLLAAVATCLALFSLARRLLPEPLWMLPPLLYGVISACKQPADGLAVNGELLMNLPCALAALCSLDAGRRRGPGLPTSAAEQAPGMERAAGAGLRAQALLLDLCAGALGSVAALYKYQAAVVLFALPALWLEGVRGRPSARAAAVARRAVPAVLGALLPLAAAAAYFRSRGALDEAIAWGVSFNRNYLAEGPRPLWALGRFALALAGVVLPGAILYGGGLGGLWRLVRRSMGARAGEPVELTSARGFVAAWALLSLGSVFLGLRFFGHYFLQAELPLSLLAAGPAARLLAARPRLARAALLAPALSFLLLAALPRVSRPLFNARDPDYQRIGRAVEARTAPGDTIWVWGNVPQLYFASSRNPGVRFSFCNYLTGLSPGTPSEYDAAFDPRAHAVPWAWALALQDLDRNKPALVLDTAAAGFKSYGKFPIAAFPELEGYLRKHYRQEGSIEGVVVYRRRD